MRKTLFSCLLGISSISLFAQNITTEQLKDYLWKPNWVVVDTRSSDAYNGWRLEGEKREGHIKSATDFSANWLRKEKITEQDKKILKERLKLKGIVPQNNIILYDVNGKDSKLVANYLKTLGIKKIYFYDGKDWINNSNLPMEKFKNYQMLVPPVWVDKLLKGEKPEGYKGNGYKVFEVAWGDVKKDKSYLEGHLPGAVHINTDEIEFPPLWSTKSDKELLQFAKNNGININQTIILYGDNVMASYRIASILKYIGVKDVRVINGGTEALKRDGIKLVKGIVNKKPTNNIGTDKILNKDYIVDMRCAKEAISNPNEQLVDIRTKDEYIGKISGYDYLDRKGRPTGAVFGDSGYSAVTLENYRNIDNTMRNGYEILSMWEKLGINPKKRLVFFCGSGWRAGEVLIYSNVLGLDKNSVYANGWMEWSYYKGNPITVEYKERKK